MLPVNYGENYIAVCGFKLNSMWMHWWFSVLKRDRHSVGLYLKNVIIIQAHFFKPEIKKTGKKH